MCAQTQIRCSIPSRCKPQNWIWKLTRNVKTKSRAHLFKLAESHVQSESRLRTEREIAMGRRATNSSRWCVSHRFDPLDFHCNITGCFADREEKAAVADKSLISEVFFNGIDNSRSAVPRSHASFVGLSWVENYLELAQSSKRIGTTVSGRV